MEKPKIDLRPKVHPLLSGMSDYLKNPANYITVMKQIVDSVQTTCNHSDMLEMANCKKCTDMMLKRRRLMKKLGFKNAAQYMAWKKVHEEIQARYPLMDWKKENVKRLMEGLK